MTLCAFLVLVLVSSITAADRTGLKLRITDRAQDVLKDFGLVYLDELENNPFPSFPLSTKVGKVKITGLTLTSLKVKPANVVLVFREKSNILFEVRKLAFTGKLHRSIIWHFFSYEYSIDSRTLAFGGSGVDVTIGGTLNRNHQGHLNVGITHCKVTAEHIMTAHSGLLGFLWDLLQPVYRYLFNTQICPPIQNNIVHVLNSVLEKTTGVKELNKQRQLYLDESLSGSVDATRRSLDVPIRGLVFRPGQNNTGSEPAGPEPVLSETSLMAYLGVSNFVFNSAAVALYSSGPFDLTIPEVDQLANNVLEAVGLRKGAVRVQLSEPPTTSISEKGLSVTVAARAQSIAKPPLPPLPVSCQVHVKVVIKTSRLFLLSESIKCTSKPNTLKGIVVSGLFNVALQKMIKEILDSWFGKGLQIPLPEGVAFAKGNIKYHQGFLVVGGDLKLTPAGKKKLVKILG